MQLSTKGRYAVMAMVDLATHGDHNSLPLALIAARQNISVAYLEQLFMKLRRAGLVKAVRGPKGGYSLAMQPSEISIAAIMTAADEPVRMNRCTVEGTDWCLGTKRCATHDLWKALGIHISSFLDAVSLQDVLDDNVWLAATKAAGKEPMKQRVAAQ
jgi:Rrf2 family transcriptional regulator, iron-sulfur cluster assembly transcription factor